MNLHILLRLSCCAAFITRTVQLTPEEMFQKQWLSYRTVRSATEKFPAPEMLLKPHFEMPLRPPSGRRNRHIRHARSPINYEGDVFLRRLRFVYLHPTDVSACRGGCLILVNISRLPDESLPENHDSQQQ